MEVWCFLFLHVGAEIRADVRGLFLLFHANAHNLKWLGEERARRKRRSPVNVKQNLNQRRRSRRKLLVKPLNGKRRRRRGILV
jgi:hypothetical protein